MEEKVIKQKKRLYDSVFKEFVETMKNFGVDPGIDSWIMFPDDTEYDDAMDRLRTKIADIKAGRCELSRHTLESSHELAASIVTNFGVQKNYSLNHIGSVTNRCSLELEIKSHIVPGEYVNLKKMADYYGYFMNLTVKDGDWLFRFRKQSEHPYKAKFQKATFD